jgi:hypothetical protein
MLKLTVLLGMLLLLVMAGPAQALMSYTFAGGGLDGTLFLDDSSPFIITHELFGTAATLDSPLNFVSGAFGDFTFSGIPELLIFQDERPDPLTGKFNVWIVDATVTGPEVGGRAPTRIRLGYDGSSPVSISLTPPTLSGQNFDSFFFFGMFFSDGTTDGCCVQPVNISGPVPVPEPPLTPLLVLGVAACLALRRRIVTR